MDSLQHPYNTAERIFEQYHKIIFLETCLYYRLTPRGLKLRKKAQSSRRSDDVQKRWDPVLSDAERTITRITVEEEVTTMRIEETDFWSAIEVLRCMPPTEQLITSEWLAKLKEHLSKHSTKLIKQKSRKLKDISRHLDDDVVERFTSRMNDFAFRDVLWNFTNDFYPEVNDIVT